MSFKALFLDRDGVINKGLGYVSKIDDFDFFEDIFETCLEFKKKGYKIIIVTNQSGIARGYFTEDEFFKLTEWMDWNFIDKGIEIDGIYYCPHHYEHGQGKYKIKCKCRKPEPGMILDAAKEHNINETMSMASGRTGKTGKTLRRAKLPHKEGSATSALGKSAFSGAGGHRRSLHQHS